MRGTSDDPRKSVMFELDVLRGYVAPRLSEQRLDAAGDVEVVDLRHVVSAAAVDGFIGHAVAREDRVVAAAAEVDVGAESAFEAVAVAAAVERVVAGVTVDSIFAALAVE